MYIPIPRLPDVPKSALFGSQLTWSVYSGMDILAKSIPGRLWALGITSVSTIMSGLLLDMAIKRSSRLFGRWSMLVYSRLKFEHVTSVALDLFRLFESFRCHSFTLICCLCGLCSAMIFSGLVLVYRYDPASAYEQVCFTS